LELTRDVEVRRAYSRDASGLEMIPDAVARPRDPQDVIGVITEAKRLGTFLTPAGSQTSMTGASITDRGILVSLSGMNRIIDIDVEKRIAKVEPGITIGALNRELRETGLHFAPDPTSENDATIGGAIACNASGARSLRYGATRRHVAGLDVVGPEGKLRHVARRRIEKNTVGYFAVQDPIDWYIGSEGTLGVIVDAELSLVPVPVNVIGIAIPFTSQRHALQFVVAAREQSPHLPHCLEYFDVQALTIAGDAAGQPWSSETGAMVYLEDELGESHDDQLLDDWLSLAESHSALSDDIRTFEGAAALREARRIRHSVPATMNERGARYREHGGRKVSTDWSVDYRLLGAVLDAASEAARRHGVPEPVTYGHAGNGHPHQNFIAGDAEALERIHLVVEETLMTVFRYGGTFSAEHGVGKLKRTWLERQLNEDQLNVMRAIKQSLDPGGIFSPGNVL
jgi:glycolate oxidase